MLTPIKSTTEQLFTHADGRYLKRILTVLGTGNDALWWLEQRGRNWLICDDAAELEDCYRNSLGQPAVNHVAFTESG